MQPPSQLQQVYQQIQMTQQKLAEIQAAYSRAQTQQDRAFWIQRNQAINQQLLALQQQAQTIQQQIKQPQTASKQPGFSSVQGQAQTTYSTTQPLISQSQQVYQTAQQQGAQRYSPAPSVQQTFSQPAPTILVQQEPYQPPRSVPATTPATPQTLYPTTPVSTQGDGSLAWIDSLAKQAGASTTEEVPPAPPMKLSLEELVAKSVPALYAHLKASSTVQPVCMGGEDYIDENGITNDVVIALITKTDVYHLKLSAAEGYFEDGTYRKECFGTSGGKLVYLCYEMRQDGTVERIDNSLIMPFP